MNHENYLRHEIDKAMKMQPSTEEQTHSQALREWDEERHATDISLRDLQQDKALLVEENVKLRASYDRMRGYFCDYHLGPEDPGDWTQSGCPVCALGKQDREHVDIQNKLREVNARLVTDLAAVMLARDNAETMLRMRLKP